MDDLDKRSKIGDIYLRAGQFISLKEDSKEVSSLTFPLQPFLSICNWALSPNLKRPLETEYKGESF